MSAPRDAGSTGAELGMVSLARQLRAWTDTVLGFAGTATDMSLLMAKSALKEPAQQAAVERAGSFLRDLRQTAGLTTEELGKAIDVGDGSLLALAESGKAALPFDTILRLAGVLGRNDPFPVLMQLTRSYNPEFWTTLENLGIGKLMVQAGRERELGNIYRSHDGARLLSDEEFAAVLAFTNAAFESALALSESLKKSRPERNDKA